MIRRGIQYLFALTSTVCASCVPVVETIPTLPATNEDQQVGFVTREAPAPLPITVSSHETGFRPCDCDEPIADALEQLTPTVAVCGEATRPSSYASCSEVCGSHLDVIASANSPCSVTSDTGSCSSAPDTRDQVGGVCCVCRSVNLPIEFGRR
ncbi:MAG: hypothetical protein ACYTHJ_03680 [Planctomycetota bacterium]